MRVRLKAPCEAMPEQGTFYLMGTLSNWDKNPLKYSISFPFGATVTPLQRFPVVPFSLQAKEQQHGRQWIGDLP